ncbi:hypothetical protein [Actinoplanes sp. NPDC020271]|uniref:hypothetical protein n=1 Tax=Actinoplanes sp. NPDC020271 TaxID=3363896 RepID=UPI0037B85BE5
MSLEQKRRLDTELPDALRLLPPLTVSDLLDDAGDVPAAASPSNAGHRFAPADTASTQGIR